MGFPLASYPVVSVAGVRGSLGIEDWRCLNGADFRGRWQLSEEF